MNEVQIFRHDEFGEIRTVTIDGEIYFVGTDIAKALGYKNPRDAIRNHVDKKDVVKRYPLWTNGGIQQTNIVNESGFYSLVLASRIPGAKRFKRWVTAEVLPTIRKTGGYSSPKLITTRIFEELDNINTNVNSLRAEIKERIDTQFNEKPLKKSRPRTLYGGVFMQENRKSVSIAQLQEGKIWTNWTWTTHHGKRTKRPLSKVNVPQTWLTYADALKVQQQSGSELGIGIMFVKNSDGLALCGIDIDAHNVDENPLARAILDMFSDTYIEKSPSGKGFHVLFFAQLDKLPDETTYKKLYYSKNSELDVECYISGMTNRYFTFTGNQTSEGDCVTDKTETLLVFLEKFMKKIPPPVSLKNRNAPIDVSERLTTAMNASNGNLFSALYNGSTDGYESLSEAVQAFVDMLVFYFGDGGESLVRDVYMQSGLAVGKWAERSDIIDATISNAFQRVSERYMPPHQNGRSSKLTGGEADKSSRAEKKPMLDYSLFADYVEKQGYSIRYNQITHNFEFFGFDKGESAEHLAEGRTERVRGIF